ncbi:hypothetical protein [Agromyces sp. PvR057]|uniref:hypothetical protein n=1 Tax=Agromyces sp. PvR057 TaxID=3156403 RepID=UPI00339520C3
MSSVALIIAGIIQICIAPALILGRQAIADSLTSNVPALDIAWFHVRGSQVMVFAGIAGTISGAAFIGLGAASLAYT